MEDENFAVEDERVDDEHDDEIIGEADAGVAVADEGEKEEEEAAPIPPSSPPPVGTLVVSKNERARSLVGV